MNNTQFRRLVFDTPSDRNDVHQNEKKESAPSTLGTKKSSFMPMTPRNVKGTPDLDFARQVRERNAALQPTTKKFQQTVPKGVRYGKAYIDRTKARAEGADDPEDDKASRITALEEQMKLGQISEETFAALRDEITGGEISSTHLVKGLDRKLLERVRRGEDVLGVGGDEGSVGQPPDVDEALEKLEGKEVEAVTREKADKKGNMAPPPPVAGTKRSRDEIMAELKVQRKAAAEAKAMPALDNRWRKVGDEKSRIKIDHKGREVLITVDEDGVVKRKVRKVSAADNAEEKAGLEMPDENKAVLGSDAIMPALVQPDPEEDEDDDDDNDDIFEGMGAEYNPLGNDDEDDDSSDNEDESDQEQPNDQTTKNKPPSEPREVSPEKEDHEISDNMPKAIPRNYFNDAPSKIEEPTQDRMAGVQEFLKKAAKMDSVRSADPDVDGEDVKEDREARRKKRAQMLAQQDRDFEDMDMGFGSSRYDDAEEEEDGKRVKLSEWKESSLAAAAAAGDDEHVGTKGDRSKKKRKPKKRKGDANSMGDIMRVIEGRKGS